SGVALCLVDRATGAVLWFNFTPVGTRNLTDAGDADDLIRQSYSDFHRAARMQNESATPRPGHDQRPARPMGDGGGPQWHRPAPALAEPRPMAIATSGGVS